VIDNDPIGTAGREVKKLARLGDRALVCFLCGYSDPVALISVSPEWLRTNGCPTTLFEDHHIVGKNHDPKLTQLICRNCHAMAGEGLLRAGVSMTRERDPNVHEALRLEGLATFHEQVAASLRAWAAEKRINKDE
jgi:hypothetical protein